MKRKVPSERVIAALIEILRSAPEMRLDELLEHMPIWRGDNKRRVRDVLGKSDLFEYLSQGRAGGAWRLSESGRKLAGVKPIEKYKPRGRRS